MEELFENTNREDVEIKPVQDEYENDKENTSSASSTVADTLSPSSISIATQTGLTMKDIQELENIKQSQETENLVLSESWFEANDERVRFYNGLTAMTVLMTVFELIRPALPERKSLTKFQQLLITIMHL